MWHQDKQQPSMKLLIVGIIESWPQAVGKLYSGIRLSPLAIFSKR
jgi:hypothetical protein